MEILVNGAVFALAVAPPGAPPVLADLVHALGFADRRLAIEVNGDLVPRSAHPTHPLHPGDRVEIVQAIGGG